MHGRHLNKLFYKRGFTAIELTAVIVIMGIIGAAVISPLVYDTGHMKLEGEAKRLLADIRYTQSLSMFRNARYRLNFSNSSAGGSYSILTSNGGSYNYFAAGGTTIQLEPGTSLAINSTSNYLVFNGLGVPSLSSSSAGSGSATTSNTVITLTHNGKTKTITITPGTGLAVLS